jgi:hypothetical protein
MSFLVQKRAFFVQILPENDKNGSETGAPGAGVQPGTPPPPYKPENIDCETLKPSNQSRINDITGKTAEIYRISTPVKSPKAIEFNELQRPKNPPTAVLFL